MGNNTPNVIKLPIQCSQDEIRQFICERNLAIRNDDNWLRAQRESVAIIIKEKKYIPQYRYRSNPYTDKQLTNLESYTMYKLARVMTHNKMSKYVVAMLTLKVPKFNNRIVLNDVDKLIDIDPMDAKYANKECVTGTVLVDAVQFIGASDRVKKIYDDFKKGDSHIVSNFDGKFRYTLQHIIVEMDFGTEGIGNCLQGIHLFSSQKSALKYAGAKGFLADFVWTPVITPEYYKAREVDEKLQDMTDNNKFNIKDIKKIRRENNESDRKRYKEDLKKKFDAVAKDILDTKDILDRNNVEMKTFDQVADSIRDTRSKKTPVNGTIVCDIPDILPSQTSNQAQLVPDQSLTDLFGSNYLAYTDEYKQFRA